MLTLFESFDLGTFSFALALGASAYGVGVGLPVPLTSQTYKMACGVGYGAVAANYLLGIVLVSEFSLRVYFGMGMLFWIVALNLAFMYARQGGLDADAATTYSQI